MKTPDAILTRLREASSAVVVCHVRPDGDTLGAALALCWAWKDRGVPARVVVDDGVADMYHWMDPDGDIRSYQDPEDLQADLVVYVDSTEPGRFGQCGHKGVHDMCIDHHISNQKFAEMNWVEAEASSTAEMAYVVLRDLGWTITTRIAEALYVGIATDTGGFNYTNTSPDTHRVAATLMECGVVPRTVNARLYDERPYEEFALRARAYDSIESTHDGDVASLTITQADLENSGADKTMTHDFVNLPRSVKGSKIALFFLEHEDGMVKISLRSEAPYDVNAIANAFHGGGHVRAAGCRVDGSMDDVKSRLWERVAEELAAHEEDA